MVIQSHARLAPPVQEGGRTEARWWLPYSYALLAAALLILPAILNGGPVFYWDTEAYLSRPASVLFQVSPELFDTHWVDRQKIAEWSSPGVATGEAGSPNQWMAGRSIYWGLVAYSFVLLLGEWGIVVLNALLAGTVLSLAWFRCFQSVRPLLFPPLVLALAFFTPLGVTVAFAMPDLLAGLLILSLGLLAACWRQLLWADRIVLALIGGFATVSHDSHVAIAALMLPLCLLVAMFRGETRRFSMAQAAWLAAPLLAGLAGGLLFSEVAEARTGNPPLRLPHLSARVTNIEAGQRFIAEQCDTADFVVCDFADRLPVHWVDFLFDPSPDKGVFGAAPPPVKRQLADEQTSFALAVASEYPLSFVGELAADGLRQVATFDHDEMNPRRQVTYFSAVFPPPVFQEIRQTRLWTNPALLDALDWATAATTLSFALIIAGAFFLHFTGAAPLPERIVLVTSVVILGVLINAAVCGMLASPLGRFQARVVWLVPFFGIPLLMLAAQSWAARKEERRVCDA